jgi:hypothetical protein
VSDEEDGGDAHRCRREGCRREELRGETILRGCRAFNGPCEEAKMERKETAKTYFPQVEDVIWREFLILAFLWKQVLRGHRLGFLGEFSS